MKCPFCGITNKKNATYCKSCHYDFLFHKNKFESGKNLENSASKSSIMFLRGRYKFFSEIGSGGMGKIYKAMDMTNGTFVAIKQILPCFANIEEREYFKERFNKEIEILCNLKHKFIPDKNIPEVIDYFEEFGCKFLVMKYLEGENLETILEKRKNKQITLEECLKWMLIIIDTLNFLHNQEIPILHRDIKPSNIILTESGKIYLVDFGIARTISSATTTKTVVGTPGFAPPEQFTGKYSFSYDIYSLGATFHYLLSGDHPSNREPFKFNSLSNYRDDIPGDLQKIFDRMLSYQEKDRYTNFDEVRSDFCKVYTNEMRKIDRQKPIKSCLEQIVYSIFFIFFIFIIVLSKFSCDKESSSKSYRRERQSTYNFPIAGYSYTPPHIPEYSPFPPLRPILLVPKKNKALPPFNKWGIIKSWNNYYSNVNPIVYSVDGKYIISGGSDSTIRIWDVKTEECIKAIDAHSDNISEVTLSSDGKYIASGSLDKTIKIWKYDTGKLIKTIQIQNSRIISLAFSPNGKNIASFGSGKEGKKIKIYDIFSGKLIKSLEGHSDIIESITYSPDGRNIASGGYDTMIKIWDSKSGNCLMSLKSHKYAVNSVVFSLDGAKIASGSEDKTIKIWDVKYGTCIKTLETPYRRINSLSWSPDGKYIAAVGRSNVGHFSIWDVDNGECLLSRDLFSQGNSVIFSPNGKSIAVGREDGAIIIIGKK